MGLVGLLAAVLCLITPITGDPRPKHYLIQTKEEAGATGLLEPVDGFNQLPGDIGTGDDYVF